MNRPDHAAIEFATAMASCVHELKNSVGSMVDRVDSLEDDLGPNLLAKPSLEALRIQAGRVQHDLTLLLQVFGMERGMGGVHMNHVDLEEFAEDVTAQLAPLCALSNARFEASNRGGTTGFFDESLIASVIGSMTHNAVRAGADKVFCDVDREDDWLIIRIGDNGPGFPHSILEDGDGAGRSLEPDRTGLGIYFARRLTHAHSHKGRHGKVQLKNRTAGGAEVTLLLP